MPKESTNNKLSCRFSTLCISSVLFVMLFVTPSLVAAECSPFPQSKLWGPLNHEDVSRNVITNYNGNWIEYLSKLENQHKLVQEAYNNGLDIVIGDNQTRLNGLRLRIYLYKIGRRVEISHCLALERNTLTGLSG